MKPIANADAEPPDDVQTSIPLIEDRSEKQQEEPRKKLNPLKTSDVKMRETGVIIETLDQELAACRMLVDSKMVPAAFDVPGKLFAARQLARELGLPVMAASRQIMVINNTPAIWGELPLALVHSSGKLESIEDYFIDAQYRRISLENKNLNAEIFAAICEIKRKDHPKKTFHFTLAQAQTAKLTGKAIWKDWLSIMMFRKARGLAIKSEFPDVLQGVAIAEYDFNEIPGRNSPPRDVSESVAGQANSLFGNQAEEITEE